MSGLSSSVRLEVSEGIAQLWLARPQSGNSLDLELGRAFLAAAFEVEAARARVVLLRGEGKNFCFGGDLKGMIASGADVTAYLSELTTYLHAGIAHLARLDAPVIAAVQGTAAGAGLGLVLASDLALAARSAKFAPAYLGVGLTPDASCTFLLPRAIGSKRAMELLLTNRVLGAQEALDWGLINQVIDDEQLGAAAEALARRLAAGPTAAYGELKRLLAEAQPGLEAQLGREGRAIAARGASREGREGIAAFLEKRAPRFE